MSDKQSVAIRIAGQTLYLLTEEEPRYVHDLAQYLSACMEEIRQGSESASAYQIALLAGLRVTDELFMLKRSMGTYQDQVQDKVQRVLRLLNEQERLGYTGRGPSEALAASRSERQEG